MRITMSAGRKLNIAQAFTENYLWNVSVIPKTIQPFTCVLNNFSTTGAGTESGEGQDRWQFIPAYSVYYENSQPAQVGGYAAKVERLFIVGTPAGMASWIWVGEWEASRYEMWMWKDRHWKEGGRPAVSRGTSTACCKPAQPVHLGWLISSVYTHKWHNDKKCIVVQVLVQEQDMHVHTIVHSLLFTA